MMSGEWEHSEIGELVDGIMALVPGKEGDGHGTSRIDREELVQLFERTAGGDPMEDPVSEWYASRMTRDERRRTGQVYTPPPVAYMMASMTVGEGGLRILDPACGCGTFLRATLLALGEMEGEGGVVHELVGIEPRPLPAALARMGVAALTRGQRNVQTEIRVDDFLLSGPDERYDLILGNPPYMRHEAIGSARRVRDFFREEYRVCEMPRRSDLYAYFVEQAVRWLAPGGRLVFLVPDKWMDVGYGTGLKRFILENFASLRFISPASNLFPEAEVDSIIMDLAGKGRGGEEDEVVFLRLDEGIPYEGMVGILGGSDRARRSGGGGWCQRVDRSTLDPEDRWRGHLLDGEGPELMDRAGLVPLGDLDGVRVRRGMTTNQTEFFFPSPEVVERLGIPDGFLRPAIKSPRQFRGLSLERAPSRLLVLPAPGEGIGNADETGLERVLQWGDERIWGRSGDRRLREVTSLKRRGDRWYVLDLPPIPDILMPKFVREGRPRFIWNRAGVLASDAFQMIYVDGGEEEVRLLLGLLNSIMGALACEMGCRLEGRGLLQIMTYELEGLRIPDPASISREDEDAIARGFEDFVRTGVPKDLDRAVARAVWPDGEWEACLERAVGAYETIRERRLVRYEPRDLRDDTGNHDL